MVVDFKIKYPAKDWKLALAECPELAVWTRTELFNSEYHFQFGSGFFDIFGYVVFRDNDPALLEIHTILEAEFERATAYPGNVTIYKRKHLINA